MSSKFLFIISLLNYVLAIDLSNIIEISEAQFYFYNRLKSKDFVNNPYLQIKSSQVCTGTSSGLSGGRNDYEILQAIYTGCVYVDGNLEITNFKPDINDIYMYDFSFLDSIREITGYLIIFNTNIKSIRLKNLQIIRGKTLFSSNYSVFIASNDNLERLDLTNLTEVQRGSSFIADNPKLCNMNEVQWNDIFNDYENNYIHNNANSYQCSRCSNSCCQNNNSEKEICGCWFPNGCQKLSRLKCSSKCPRRCYGPGKFDCCYKECIGGCTGPTSKDCLACKKFQILETGECVDSCPRIKMVDAFTGELVHNKDGMYQYGITCVRSCPKNLFIYQELCLTKCPEDTNEEEEVVNNPVTGEKGLRRVCKPCEGTKCKKTCVLRNTKQSSETLNHENLYLVKDCEILNGNLIIIQSNLNTTQLTEADLEILSSIRIINGIVRIQSDLIKTIDFLRNLEVIRTPNLEYSKYSLIITGKSLRFLNLKKLRSIENGDIVLSAQNLCLHDTIDWEIITKRKNSLINNIKSNGSCEAKCHIACEGCWSPEQSYCQFCKNYKLEDLCIEKCEGIKINNRYTYIENKQNRVCKYCHSECENGCIGSTEWDCFECVNFKLRQNGKTKCVNQCPSSHYLNFKTNECLPCAVSCFGCHGPEERIDDRGCIHCNSALVDNDSSFTIFKCILWNNTCPAGYFHDVVNLKNHPLKGRDVCRKCHKECESCNGSGTVLGQGCIKCKNFYSVNLNECVGDCWVNNGFRKKDTNICSACNEECKAGCQGNSTFECNECRAYKLKLNDAIKVVEVVLKNFADNYLNLTEKIGVALKILERQSFSKTEFQILENYAQLLKQKSKLEHKNTIFCVRECPKEFPYTSYDFFCSSRNNERKSLNFVFYILFLAILTMLIFLSSIIVLKKSRVKKINLSTSKKNSNEYSSDCNHDYLNEKVNLSNLILFNDNELEQCTFLGQGAFGIVYSGFYIFTDEKNKQSKIRVAIKKLNYFPTMNNEKIKELENEIINEATLMASVNHKYCLKLMGLCIAQPIKIVTQLIAKGSVVTVLQKYRNEISEKNLLLWAKQIAEGMEYLQSEGIVHRDLAARNILVKELDHIKITDFGLAKVLDSEEKAFYAKSNSLLPIKWLAIESIQNKIFTHESDVWSYGICLWEIFTFCAKPYSEIETINIVNYLKKGVRLSQPKIASIEVYAILLKCWLENPCSRPSFKELNSIFSRMCIEPKNYLSFKSHTNENFMTINQNTEALIRQTQGDMYDCHFYEEDDIIKNNSEKKSTNNSISPDEGIEMNSIEVQCEECYQKINSLSNYNQSLVVFKRNSKSGIDKRTKEFVTKTKKNKSLLKKLLPKRFGSNGSDTTASTYISSVYSNGYEEQQSLFTSSSHLPTRSNSSNSSNNSSIYNYNTKFRNSTSNSDYLQPIMPNVKQNLEYFDNPNHVKTNPIIVMDTEKAIPPKIIDKNLYYNDSFI